MKRSRLHRKVSLPYCSCKVYGRKCSHCFRSCVDNVALRKHYLRPDNILKPVHSSHCYHWRYSRVCSAPQECDRPSTWWSTWRHCGLASHRRGCLVVFRTSQSLLAPSIQHCSSPVSSALWQWLRWTPTPALPVRQDSSLRMLSWDFFYQYFSVPDSCFKNPDDPRTYPTPTPFAPSSPVEGEVEPGYHAATYHGEAEIA